MPQDYNGSMITIQY